MEQQIMGTVVVEIVERRDYEPNDRRRRCLFSK